MTPAKWNRIYTNGKRLLSALLDIEVPVVAAINGPASVHAELALLSDIVIASDDSYLQDAPHFRYGTVPGDGVQAIWPLLLGPNRGRFFLLTGQRISAIEAQQLGVVAEVHPRSELLDHGGNGHERWPANRTSRCGTREWRSSSRSRTTCSTRWDMASPSRDWRRTSRGPPNDHPTLERVWPGRIWAILSDPRV